MPKERSNRVLSSRRSRASAPYPDTRGPQVNASDSGRPLLRMDWEDAICPICMNPPHNAVLLLCSSYENGCRPYMCDTSYRHSNCLDQFKKMSAALDATLTGSDDANESSTSNLESVNNSGSEAVISDTISGTENLSGEQDIQHNAGVEQDSHERTKMACPLCRGQVKGSTVVQEARRYLDTKTRSCAQESCPFSGTYAQLRKHARLDHPCAQPTEVDPVRRRNWQRLEQESNISDVLSTIRSTMPGALVFGDYVIENGNIDNGFDDGDFSADDGNWWSFLLLVQYLDPNARITIRRTTPSQDHTRHGSRLGQALTLSEEDSGAGNDASAEDNISGSNVRGLTRLPRDRFTRFTSRRHRGQR